MAQQEGIVPLKGTIGNITFYKSKDGFLARSKGGVDGKRIASDPAFQRTRENGFEFGRAGVAGKLLRNALRALLQNATFNANFGIGAGYNFTKSSGIGMDVLYSLQGQRYELNGFETNQKINYVKIPVYYSYTGDPSKAISFIGKVGPQVSILTDSRLTDKDGEDINPDTKDRYKDVTFGAVAAAGAQFKLNNKLFLTTMTRFDYDFTNAEDDSYVHYTAGRAKTYNGTLGLEVGFKYLFR